MAFNDACVTAPRWYSAWACSCSLSWTRRSPQLPTHNLSRRHTCTQWLHIHSVLLSILKSVLQRSHSRRHLHPPEPPCLLSHTYTVRGWHFLTFLWWLHNDNTLWKRLLVDYYFIVVRLRGISFYHNQFIKIQGVLNTVQRYYPEFMKMKRLRTKADRCQSCHSLHCTVFSQSFIQQSIWKAIRAHIKSESFNPARSWRDTWKAAWGKRRNPAALR